MFPSLQIALDVVELSFAEDLASKCWFGDCTWIEVGTPLIKSEGVKAIRRLRDLLPEAVIVADMKCMDAGFIEVELAASSGADIISVLGVASDATILEALRASRNYGVKIVVDLISSLNPLKRALEIQDLGVDMVCFHTGIDVQRALGMFAHEGLINYINEACSKLSIPVAVAGGITLDKVKPLMDAGVEVVVVGSAITRSKDPRKAAHEFINLIRGG